MEKLKDNPMIMLAIFIVLWVAGYKMMHKVDEHNEKTMVKKQ